MWKEFMAGRRQQRSHQQATNSDPLSVPYISGPDDRSTVRAGSAYTLGGAALILALPHESSSTSDLFLFFCVCFETGLGM